MYFSDDSWGKFLKGELDEYQKVYMNNIPFHPITENMKAAEFAAVVEELFNKPIPKPLAQPEIMKQLLEGLKMPVKNPKTGETDYVDIKLVDKIVVDAQYVEDMLSNNRIKFDVKLSGNEATQKVNILMSSKELGLSLPKEMDLQQFEEILFSAIHDTKEQRLEDVKTFSVVITEMMDTLVDYARSNKQHVARLDEKYLLDNGIGIIRDTKTNQEVGTFESMEYIYQRNERVAQLDGIILSGRSIDDLEEKDRFEFAYYSLNNGFAYSLMASARSSVKSSKGGESFSIHKYEIIIDEFQDTHGAYQTVVTAQEKKSLLDGIIDINGNPVDTVKMEQFTQSRLDILEESKNRQKQEKLVGQFMDIDIDF